VSNVVFADLEPTACGPAFSRQVAERLAKMTPERICLVADAAEQWQFVRQVAGRDGDTTGKSGEVRLHRNLWFLPIEEMLAAPEQNPRQGHYESGFLRLRSQFAYSVIHAPPLAQGHDAAQLARHADGLILLLQANETRRHTAVAAKARLDSAGVTLLGTVLLGRRFPIPPGLYQRL
jgi:hypothetical protein